MWQQYKTSHASSKKVVNWNRELITQDDPEKRKERKISFPRTMMVVYGNDITTDVQILYKLTPVETLLE